MPSSSRPGRMVLWLLCGFAGVAAAAEPAREIDPGVVADDVDPCVDFYSYACKPWLTSHPIPADMPSIAPAIELDLRTREQLHQILEAARAPAPTRSERQRQVGDYYAACMAPASDGKAALAPLLARIDALADKRELPALLAEVHLATATLMGDRWLGPALFSFSSVADYDDATRMVGVFDQSGAWLPDRELYLGDSPHAVSVRDSYVRHATRIAARTGEQLVGAQLLALEQRLARAALDEVARRDPRQLNHRLAPAEWATLMPHFDLAAYLRALGVAPRPMLFLAPGYFRALDELVQREPLAQLKLYLRWCVYNAAARFVGAIADEDFDFYERTLAGVRTPPPRWRRCVEAVDRDLGEALGALWMERHLPPARAQAARLLVRDLVAAMGRELDGLPWMSDATKRAARAKLAAVVVKVGGPAQPRDYGRLRIVRDDWLADAMAASRFELQRQLAKIGRPVDRDEWFETAPSVNAYYEPHTNSINFDGGELQPPLFADGLDDAATLGGLGSTIGHELTHAFDDEGQKYDGAGNLRDWWSAADARAFAARAQCTVEQYDGYTVLDGVHVNGKLSLGENLADAGGVIVAYRALEARLAARHLSPSARVAARRRFFVTVAQHSCRNDTPASLRGRAEGDTHAPAYTRVLGPLSTMPEFRAAFQCRAGQPMVAPRQCRVW